jgi:hypothetical protein
LKRVRLHPGLTTPENAKDVKELEIALNARMNALRMKGYSRAVALRIVNEEFSGIVQELLPEPE